MQARLTLSALIASIVLAACGGSSNSPRAVDTPPATNTGGTPVTGVLTARFDPSAGVIPLPNNLLLSPANNPQCPIRGDLTLNIPLSPGVDCNNTGDPTVALNTIDGWSTVAPWTANFNASPAPASIVPGSSVRVFEVTLNQPGGAVTGIVRELQAGTEFVTALAPSDTTGRTLAIVPTSPLKQLTTYMVVMTNGIRDANGNDATPDQTYFLAKRQTPLCVNGASTEPLLPAATACALEPLRQLTFFQLAAAGAAGIPRDNVVLSWTFTTQSITPVLQTVRAITQPSTIVLAPTGLNTGAAGLPPIADIYVGFLDLPYYLLPPSADNPTGPLNGFWKAAPGNYQGAAAQFGLDPRSTNITAYNPIPVANATVRVPVLMTVPNAASTCVRPDGGWPLTIFQHGITRNRTDGLAISATLASPGVCTAMVAIDQPLHGLSPGNSGFDSVAAFYINANNPLMAQLFGAGTRERTFDVDYINNTTGAPGPDGTPDASGTHTINLASLLTSRDNLRQAVADLFVLTASVPRMNIDGDPAGDFDASRISFVGQSLGAIVGTPFIALEPNVDHALLSVPGGGIAQLLNGSASFGPRIRAGLAAAGVQAGTPDFDRFLGAAQQAIDPVDPINYGFASANNAIILHEVVGNGADIPSDRVIPNSVPGAPLAGTEPLIRVLGLPAITEAGTYFDPNGVRGAVRFVRGEHGSLLSPARTVGVESPQPAGFLDVTQEMQRQMASFVASGGTAVIVTDTSVIRTQ